MLINYRVLNQCWRIVSKNISNSTPSRSLYDLFLQSYMLFTAIELKNFVNQKKKTFARRKNFKKHWNPNPLTSIIRQSVIRNLGNLNLDDLESLFSGSRYAGSSRRQVVGEFLPVLRRHVPPHHVVHVVVERRLVLAGSIAGDPSGTRAGECPGGLDRLHGGRRSDHVPRLVPPVQATQRDRASSPSAPGKLIPTCLLSLLLFLRRSRTPFPSRRAG